MSIASKPMIKNISDSCPNVYNENIQIKQVHECKTLEVTIDQHLSWKSNTEDICKKVTAGISAIRRIKPFVDQDTLFFIYRVNKKKLNRFEIALNFAKQLLVSSFLYKWLLWELIMWNNEKNFSNSNFVNQGGCLFQQTKNGLRTKCKSFNRILS